MPVQPLVAGASGRRSYTVLGQDDRPLVPVETFLAHLDRLNYSPNTVKAYAHDLQDLFVWLEARELDWRALRVGDVGEWVAWLRVPKHLRDAGVPVLPTVENAVSERTLQRKLAAVSGFYDFHRRSDPRVELTLSRWSAGLRRGGFKGFLAHTERGSSRREIRLRGVLDPHPQVIARDDLNRLLKACPRLRDRFLLTVLFETGMRVGEALGLRHSDLQMAEQTVAIEPRLNANDARVKGWKPRTVPVNAELFAMYAAYMDDEYGSIDSDYVFVNLWAGRVGHPLRYSTVRSLVLRLRAVTGLAAFTPHHLRHTYATELIRRGTDWAVVQKLLGHANIQTTLGIYGHLTAADAREALIAAGWFDKAWATIDEGLSR